jgi:hypothetical protein
MNQRTILWPADCLAGGAEFELSVPFLKKRNASASSPKRASFGSIGKIDCVGAAVIWSTPEFKQCQFA